jgi:arylamine N-acetyltransferase
MSIPGDHLDAYLARLGLEAEPPSVDALMRLQRAHVERVPYETLWIQLEQGWTVDPAASLARIALEGRGGYCYHLNGAFSTLLRELGYSVTRHLSGVHGPDGPSDDAYPNHLVLQVSGLPSDDNPDGDWYVDVGLGDALHEPLPLLEGPYHQAPFRLSLERTPGSVGDWHLTHDPAGSFPGASWRSATTEMSAFEERHQWLTTSPESGFVKFLSVQRREAGAVDLLRGLTVRRLGEGATESTLTTKADLLACLADQFGITLTAIPPADLDALWRTMKQAHDTWEAAGRP